MAKDAKSKFMIFSEKTFTHKNYKGRVKLLLSCKIKKKGVIFLVCTFSPHIHSLLSLLNPHEDMRKTGKLTIAFVCSHKADWILIHSAVL